MHKATDYKSEKKRKTLITKNAPWYKRYTDIIRYTVIIIQKFTSNNFINKNFSSTKLSTKNSSTKFHHEKLITDV